MAWAAWWCAAHRHLYLIRRMLPTAFAVQSSSAKCQSKNLSSPGLHRTDSSNTSTGFENEAEKAFGRKCGG
jgi:hypothetical protein